MKRAILIAITGLLVVAPVSNARDAGQKVTGTIALPLPDPQTNGETCFQGGERRLYMASQGLITGVAGYVFDVDKKSWGKKFKVEPTAGSGAIDLDIYFYLNLGPPITEDPSMNSPSIIGEFNDAKEGGETGLVPKGATKATVCMKGGVGATFEYASK